MEMLVCLDAEWFVSYLVFALATAFFLGMILGPTRDHMSDDGVRNAGLTAIVSSLFWPLAWLVWIGMAVGRSIPDWGKWVLERIEEGSEDD